MRPAPGESIADCPVELAFLVKHGFSPAVLTSIAARASRLGVEPVREAMASGLIEEAAFYRALAAELGLSFRDGPPRLRSGGDYAAILQNGMAPSSSETDPAQHFVIAPQGRQLRHILESTLRGRSEIVVTTPTAFAEGLRAANGPALARHLAGDDAEGTQRDSARQGSSRGQRVAFGLGAVASALGGLLAPLPTFFTLAALLGPLFLALILLRIGSAIEARDPALAGGRRSRLDEARLPVYTVAVPLFREEAVLRQILKALTALDYPPAKLDVKLLVEADDIALRAALARTGLPPGFSLCIVPPGEPRTKPRALNLALLEARGPLFTIFDAEDIPDPQQLRMAAARFDKALPDVACLQARLVIDDHPGGGILPAFFALEYAALFEVLNPGLMRAGLPILLGGTSNHFRTDALRAVGGWDAWNVTEDADLAVRLARAGYGMGDLPSETREEAPLTIRAWLKQRSRWLKGYIQTIATHSRAPLRFVRETGVAAAITFLALALGTVLAALGYPLFAVVAYFAFSDGSLLAASGVIHGIAAALAAVILLLGHLALALPAIVGALRQGRPWLLALLPLLPLYYVLICVAAWMALYDYLARPFAWNKTAHGLARRRTPFAPTDGAAIRPPPLPEASRY